MSQSSLILERFIDLIEGEMFRTTRRVDDYIEKLPLLQNVFPWLAQKLAGTTPAIG